MLASDSEVNPSVKESIGEQWMVEALQKLRARNRAQVDPFVSIYHSQSKLWYENAQLRSLQSDLRHQIASVQHETAEILSTITTAKPDPTLANALAEKLKSSLSLIQNELKSKLNFDSDRRSRTDLSKKVRDQQKLLADQQEELIVSKQELAASHEKLSFIDSEMKKDKASLEAVRAELESVRALVANAEGKARKLDLENSQLVMRILREKEKAAEEFNKMVQNADAIQCKVAQPSDGHAGSGSGSSMGSSASEAAGGFLRSRGNFSTVDAVHGRTASTATMSAADLAGMSETFVSQCHMNDVNDIAIEPNTGEYFLSAGSDAIVKCFNFASTKVFRVLHCPAPVISVDIVTHRDSNELWGIGGCADGSCRVWNLQNGETSCTITGHANKVFAVKFLGSRASRVVTSAGDRTLRIWELSSGVSNTIHTIKPGSTAHSFDVSTDSQIISSGHQDGSVKFWDLTSHGTCLHTINKLHESAVTCVQYNPSSSQTVLVASKDNTLSLVDTRSYNVVQKYRAAGFRITSDWSRVSFSPDGRAIAAGGSDGKIRIWDAASGGLIGDLSSEHRKGSICAVNWAMSGLVVGDRDGNVVIWR